MQRDYFQILLLRRRKLQNVLEYPETFLLNGNGPQQVNQARFVKLASNSEDGRHVLQRLAGVPLGGRGQGIVGKKRCCTLKLLKVRNRFESLEIVAFEPATWFGGPFTQKGQ